MALDDMNSKLYEMFLKREQLRNMVPEVPTYDPPGRPLMMLAGGKFEEMDRINRELAESFGVDIEDVGPEEEESPGWWQNTKDYWRSRKDAMTRHQRSGRAKGHILKKKADMIEEQTGKRPWWDPRR